MEKPWAWGLRWLAVGLSLVAGCGKEFRPPETFVTTRVVGTLRDGGRPVRGGWIEIIPMEGTVGNLATAPIQDDGAFAADRVAVGRNQFRVAGRALNPAYRSLLLRSPIRRDVAKDSKATLTIDLLEEVARAQVEITRAP